MTIVSFSEQAEVGINTSRHSKIDPTLLTYPYYTFAMDDEEYDCS